MKTLYFSLFLPASSRKRQSTAFLLIPVSILVVPVPAFRPGNGRISPSVFPLLQSKQKKAAPEKLE
ncbi:hypothetical protein [Peribacillus glennii]|uniref:hypothetical protein n=1 Tax=Peribacillus glennii TaxID=2303991 RepID=UPI00115E13D3|nr:hypothetical protein [Peribacillus glennii]